MTKCADLAEGTRKTYSYCSPTLIVWGCNAYTHHSGAGPGASRTSQTVRVNPPWGGGTPFNASCFIYHRSHMPSPGKECDQLERSIGDCPSATQKYSFTHHNDSHELVLDVNTGKSRSGRRISFFDRIRFHTGSNRLSYPVFSERSGNVGARPFHRERF